MPFRRLFAAAAVFCVLATAAWSQVTGSLVSDVQSIQPGVPFTVALRLEHQPHWHTYWKNPGIGLPTSLKWKLPEGWKAGEIQWPTPGLIVDRTGAVVGNGYEGDHLLPVTITPPATLRPGESVTLRARADWLMCAEVCVPGGANVELSLPVADGPAKKDETWAPRIANLPMPRPPDGWDLTAVRSNDELRLSIARKSGGLELKKPHFFSTDGFIAFDEPQVVQTTASGYELRLRIADPAKSETTRLIGVLASEDPKQGWSIDVPLSNQAAATAPVAVGGGQAGLVGLLALAWFGGLILNLMPCVFPVLGIKILGFVNQAGAERRKVTLHGIAFTAGVLASFWALAGVLALLRSGGAELGWGFQLQSPAFVFVLAALLLIFALSMSGLFEVGLSATGLGSGLQSKTGYLGSFFTGVLATVVATPCSAPFLAPALGAALALEAGESFAVFTAIALGLSTPYLALSIFPQAVRILPRPGAWMETFKQVMAFPLYATVAYLVWVLAGQTKDDDNALLNILLGLTLVAMAGWLYGRYTAPGSKPGRARLGLLGGLALLGLGLAVGYPRPPAPTDLVWEPWSAEKVASLRREGKTLYVDFTARWCATCQTNKRLVFGSDEVKRLFREKSIVALKADWTNRDPAITAELARWNRSAVPFNLVYKPGQTEPVILPEILTAGTVLDALK